MARKLSDDEIEQLIMAMWSLTVDEKGVKHTAQTEKGQFTLDVLAKIIAPVLILRLKPGGEVVSLDDYRKPKD